MDNPEQPVRKTMSEKLEIVAQVGSIVFTSIASALQVFQLVRGKPAKIL